MYKILILTGNSKLLSCLKELDIWQKETEFGLFAVAKRFEDALKIAEEKSFDLVISEIPKKNADDYINLLKRDICQNVIIVGEALSLDDARFCIKNNVNDYFVPPFKSSEFAEAFERIRLDDLSYENNIDIYANELAGIFNIHSSNFPNRAADIVDMLYRKISDSDAADKAALLLLELVTKKVFEKNRWIELYIRMDEILSNNDSIDIRRLVSAKLNSFFNEFGRLCPNVQNDTMNRVILYILNNPEKDLKQKNLATVFFMNSSYLSTLFIANTERRFVDYLTDVKLRRAAWLLRNTTLKVIDIAEKLDYKDIGYFSRLFKKKYGSAPSDYRVPDSYMYCI